MPALAAAVMRSCTMVGLALALKVTAVGLLVAIPAVTIYNLLLRRYLEEQGAQVTEAKRIQPSLEDVFVQITGIEADAMRREKEKKAGGQ